MRIQRTSSTVAGAACMPEWGLFTISSDSKYAFVSSEGIGAEPGKVDVIDLVARAKVATVEVGQQASGIAFWKMGH